MVMLTQLADVLRKGGLKVKEVDGWKTRGRPASTGGFNPVGVLCHHTATPKSASDAAVVRLLVGGRSDLPGPLCHLGLGRDGTVYVIAAGRANHAGVAKKSGTVAAGDGNVLYIGIEAFNDGLGEKWPAEQYDAYVKLAAVLSRDVTGNSAQTVRGHKETSVTGKVDPRFDMDDFRDDVAEELKPKPLPPKPARKAIPLRVVTENIRHALPDSDVEATIARLTSTRADIICLQEMSGRRPQVEAAKALGFDNFTPDNGVTGEAMCPILFRSSVFELRRGESVPVGEGGPVPRQAAGPSHRGPEFITYAALLHKMTGRTVHVFNVHLPPSLQLPEMRRLAEAQVKALVDLAAKVKGQVVITGDWNSTKPLDLAGAVLRDAGFRSNHEVLGTLITHEPSQRPIDAVLFRGDALTPVSQRLIVGLPSDHLPLFVRFTLAAKG